jgi:hypothetical protein
MTAEAGVDLVFQGPKSVAAENIWSVVEALATYGHFIPWILFTAIRVNGTSQ